eukprot:2444503-Rhodomonas_salina.1
MLWRRERELYQLLFIAKNSALRDTGVVMAQDGSDSLAFWGLTDKEIRQTKVLCLEVCILGNHDLANVCSKCIKDQRGLEGGDLPPRAPRPAGGPGTASRSIG